MLEGVLVVASRRQANEKTLRKAILQLELVGASVIGAVLNRAKAGKESYYYARYASSRARTRSLKEVFRRDDNIEEVKIE